MTKLALHWTPSPHFDERPQVPVSLLVIHNISLPPGQFGSSCIRDFFQGKLDLDRYPQLSELKDVRVSAHAVIYRNGRVEQFVDFDKRAWHAGKSSYQGRERCNDFAIGIELEGSDAVPFTRAQYDSLTSLTKYIQRKYPLITLGSIVGHSDIAPDRKTDPGIAFDWPRYRKSLTG